MTEDDVIAADAPGVRLYHAADVTTITLAGGRGNPIDLALAVQLEEAIGRVDPASRVVHLRAEGANFSVGGDIRSFVSDTPARVVDEIVSAFHRAIAAFSGFGMPTVATVRGWAAGGAVGLATAADIVLAGRSAIFKPAHVLLGLTSDGGTGWQLARAVGRARTADILLTAGRLTADEAYASGLISRVVDDELLERTTEEVIATLVAGPPAAQREIVRLLGETAQPSLSGYLEQERASMVRAAGGAELGEGILAFLEKRHPQFGSAVTERANDARLPSEVPRRTMS